MSFISALVLIDAPASALNNSNQKIPNAREENNVATKYIHTRAGDFPYVSGQSIRAWLRNSLENFEGWISSPVYRDAKVSYTAGNPIEFWDDDLFGYMRAPGDDMDSRLSDPSYKELTPLDVEKDKKGKLKEQVVTRISPLRFSTFVSIAPVYITVDFGTMARQESGSAVYPNGPDPVPYEHQFYRTTLQGLISLDLNRLGRFTYKDKSGYRNLDETRIKIAKEKNLAHVGDVYELEIDDRVKRAQTAIKAIAKLEGGAKQAIHYTDVTPDFIVATITRGGNNMFGHIICADAKGLPELNSEAFEEAIQANKDDILSKKIYIGWVRGFMDKEREKAKESLAKIKERIPEITIEIKHPLDCCADIANDLAQNKDWLN